MLVFRRSLSLLLMLSIVLTVPLPAPARAQDTSTITIGMTDLPTTHLVPHERSQRTIDGGQDTIERLLGDWRDVPLDRLAERPDEVNRRYVALLSADGAENEVLFLEAGGLPCDVDPELPMPVRGLRAEAYSLACVVYDNDFTHSEWSRFMPPGHVELRNVMFAPLIVAEKVVGVVGLANKPVDFTDQDADIAQALAWIVVAVALLIAVEYTLVHPAKAEIDRWRRAAQPWGVKR